MRILLVDDEPALRELLRATLEGADVSVDEAASGLEAEARIRRKRPDVIVLDLRMPGMGGTELCTHLKADPRTHKIPVIVVSAKDITGEDRARLQGQIEALYQKGSLSPRKFVDQIVQVLKEK